MAVILDAASKSAAAVLSGGNLTLSSSAGTATARADTIKSTGKFAFETSRVNPIIYGRADPGLTNQLTPSTSSLLGTVTIDRNGSVQINNVSVGFVANTEPTMWVVDLTTARLWISDVGGGWNNFTSHNPCTPVGGFDISSIVGAGLYPFGIVSDPVRSITFNFGATALVRPLPSCASTWETAAPPPTPSHGFFIQNARIPAFASRITALGSRRTMHANWATTERRDTFAARIGLAVGADMAVTEARDIFAASLRSVDVPDFVDGEVIYKLGEPELRRPAEPLSSRFVIPSEPTIVGIPFTER